MIARYLSSIGPALANHLWQSTVFAVAAWLVTLLLRRNPARVRYAVWLTASVKFLVPFSLLIGLGGLLPRSHAVVAGSQGATYSAMDAVGQPFSGFSLPMPSSVHAASLSERLNASLPILLAGVWLCGAVVMLLIWFVRWRQVYATMRRAVAVDEGREFAILRRLDGRERVAMRMSRELMEPGIFGIFRPVLVWPELLSERLEDEHIEAIMAHELMHVKRRDNMAAAIHMVVEALF